MKAWQDEFYRLVNLLFGNPPTEMELLACLVASALVAALILKVIVRSLKAGMPTAPRVLLALALSRQPDILVLDEPVTGVDVVAERLLVDGAAHLPPVPQASYLRPKP